MKYTYGLCRGRHDIPDVSDFLFDTQVNPLDVDALTEHVRSEIPEDCDQLTLYATGLTVALLAVVTICQQRDIGLTVMHFDRDSGEYYPQIIFTTEICPCCGGRQIRGGYACKWCGAT
jgi:hypothetical protein